LLGAKRRHQLRFVAAPSVRSRYPNGAVARASLNVRSWRKTDLAQLVSSRQLLAQKQTYSRPSHREQRCPSHSIGKGRINRFKLTPAGC